MKRHLAPLLLAALATVGCAQAAAPAPRITRNLDADALEIAVRWPDPAIPAVMSLANQYQSTGRNADGQAFFCERAQAVPQRALFTALCGMFRVRQAQTVSLFRRVAWVEAAMADLDRAAASDGLSRYLRGAVAARLPARFDRATQAVDDLGWMLAHAERFPPGLRRGAFAGLAAAHKTLGHDSEARDAAAQVGPGGEAISVDGSLSSADGFRFGPPRLAHPAPGIYVARGYDFADLAFVITDGGVVAIDGGTTPATAAAALAAFRTVERRPIDTVIITHAHWDHVGGLSALLGDHPRIVASARYAAELARMHGTGVPFHDFFGTKAPAHFSLSPDRLVERAETMIIGGTRFALLPVRGGETEDALLIHLPDRAILFAGDVLMPYFGGPFVAEGSVDGLFETVAAIQALHPQLILHGHTPLTENFTADLLGPLVDALRSVHIETLAAIAGGRPQIETLQRNLLPPDLARTPRAVVPFLLMRDNLIKRVYAQRTGYWKSDGEGVAVFSKPEWGAALDLVAGGDEARLERAARALIDRGDLDLGLRVVDLGLTTHPQSAALTAARTDVLDRLRAQHQFNPFKFIVYSEWAGRELAPLDEAVVRPISASAP